MNQKAPIGSPFEPNFRNNYQLDTCKQVHFSVDFPVQQKRNFKNQKLWKL